MTKTDNKKYVKRGRTCSEYNPEWEDDVSHANKGKVGAPYRYSETLIMMATALRVGLGVQYRQLKETIRKMSGEPRTPSFNQLRERMGKLDVSTNQGGMITASDPKHSMILAVDATRLKQHNRGEWIGEKWRVKRGFVERHVMVDTQTMKIVALSVTDESVGDVAEFRSLLGQSMDAIGAKGGAGGAPYHSKDPEQDTPAEKRRDGAPPYRIPKLPRVGHSTPRPAPMTIRQDPISCTGMPRTDRGIVWPRAPVRGWFWASCTGST